jgi:hypothetical protein
MFQKTNDKNLITGNKTVAHNETFFKPLIQTKLTINQADDEYEREADAMAEHVMRMTNKESTQQTFFKPSISSIQRKCAHCEEEEKHIQQKENSNHDTSSTSLEGYVKDLNSSGETLDASTKNFFEARFGYDFSDVKIHNNNEAARSAESVNALAYTNRNNIVFGSGQFKPETNEGKKLLAHELTHVIQQTVEQNAEPHLMRQQKPEDEFNSCSKNQQALIEPVINDARKAVDKATSAAAISWGKSDKIDPHVKQLFLDHFHTVSRGDIRDILGKYVSLGISFEKGIKVKCESTCDKDKNSATCGYAYNTQWFGGHGPVHICFDPAGCDFTSSSKNDRIALIIHEAAHRYTGVDDKAYRWETTKYNALTPGQAMNNADSYAWFATLL